MTWWTVAWIGWGVAFCVIEGVALFNSTRGDTLSEHFWAWTGVRTAKWQTGTDGWRGGVAVTPVWTVRVARVVVLSFLLWLALHLTTGWV